MRKWTLWKMSVERGKIMTSNSSTSSSLGDTRSPDTPARHDPTLPAPCPMSARHRWNDGSKRCLSADVHASERQALPAVFLTGTGQLLYAENSMCQVTPTAGARGGVCDVTRRSGILIPSLPYRVADHLFFCIRISIPQQYQLQSKTWLPRPPRGY